MSEYQLQAIDGVIESMEVEKPQIPNPQSQSSFIQLKLK